MSHPRWVLELGLGCSGRSGHLLNSCSVPPDPLKIVFLFYCPILFVCVCYVQCVSLQKKSACVYVQILETNARSPSPSPSLFFETGFLPEPVALHFCPTVWPENPQDPLPPHPNTGVTHIPHHTRLGALQSVTQVNNQDLLHWCPKHPKCLL